MLACAALFGAQAGSQDIFTSMKNFYGGLKAVHIVAVRTDVVTARMASGQSQSEYEFAEAEGGRYRVRYKSNDAEALEVSDGASTWKALPKAKQWTSISAAAVGGSDEEEDAAAPAKKPKDLRDDVEIMLLRRFPGLARYGAQAEFVKEENFKLGGEKIRCQMVRFVLPNGLQELWMDERTGMVVQARQVTRKDEASGPVEIQITTKIKEFDANGDVDQALFAFTPERSWAKVDMLVLPGEERTMLTGLKAADFSLKSLTGESVSLSELRGKPVVLDFWATWCGPCRRELPGVDKLRAEFGDKVQFLGINDEDSGTVKGFIRKNNYGLTVLMDSRHVVNRAYGVRNIPTLLIIDRDGVIRKHLIGGRGEAELRAAIQEVVD